MRNDDILLSEAYAQIYNEGIWDRLKGQAAGIGAGLKQGAQNIAGKAAGALGAEVKTSGQTAGGAYANAQQNSLVKSFINKAQKEIADFQNDLSKMGAGGDINAIQQTHPQIAQQIKQVQDLMTFLQSPEATGAAPQAAAPAAPAQPTAPVAPQKPLAGAAGAAAAGAVSGAAGGEVEKEEPQANSPAGLAAGMAKQDGVKKPQIGTTSTLDGKEYEMTGTGWQPKGGGQIIGINSPMGIKITNAIGQAPTAPAPAAGGVKKPAPRKPAAKPAAKPAGGVKKPAPKTTRKPAAKRKATPAKPAGKQWYLKAGYKNK